MGQLSLTVLGAPEIRHGDMLVVFPTRKTLAILIYLVVEGGRHTRDKLATLFWPDSDELRGRASLRRALSSIRSAINDPEHAASSQHIIVEQDIVRINSSSDYDADFRAVELALDRPALRSGNAGQYSPARAARGRELGALERVAALCRGEFLEGFSLPDAPEFDAWMGLQRETWHVQVGVLLEQLTHLQTEAGELARAAATARVLVAHDPFNETAYQDLIRLLLASGDRKGAENAYADLRSMLAAEWGVEPSPSTEALAAGIGNSLAITSRPGREAAVSFQSQALLERYMVGRALEFRDLIESFHTAAQGKPQSAVIVGEAGIGKTRLSTEFLGWASSQGATVLQGRAFEMSGRFPYQPIVEAMRAGLERHDSPDDLPEDIWLAELTRLMPELRERYPDLPAARRQDIVVKGRLFEAVTRLLQSLAAQQPLVLFIDDVQWADIASLDLVQYVLRRWAETGAKALLLVSMRSDSLQPSHEARSNTMGQWLAGLMREAPYKQLTLEALTESDTLRLVQSLSGLSGGSDPASDNVSAVGDFGMHLFGETGGQPFFIIETLKALLERGLLTVQQQSDTEWNIALASEMINHTLKGFVAPGVREVVRARLARLDRDAATLLIAGSVLGRDFNFDILCSVAGLPEDAVLAGLETLLDGRLLIENQASHSASAQVRYLFAHDKIREVVYAELSASRRRIFHRRALDALMSQSAPTAELAHHALAAGQIPLAFHLSLASGDTALHLFAVQDAISHYRRAQQIVTEQRTAGEQALRFSVIDLKSLYSQLGRAYELANDWDKVRSAYEEMLLLSRELCEPALESAALNRLATLGVHGSSVVEPEPLLLEALRVAEQSGDIPGIAETEWALAQMNFFQRQSNAALAHGERARQIAHDLQMGDLEARSLNVMAYASIDLGLWGQALVFGQQAQVAYVALGNKAMEADSLCVAANASIHLGRPRMALDLANDAQLISEQIENSWGRVSSGLFMTLGLIEIADPAAALEVALRGLDLARSDVQSPPMIIFALARLGGVYREIGKMQDAIRSHLDAFESSQGPGLRWWFSEMAAAELCADYCVEGDWSSAYPYAVRALSANNGALPFVALLFPHLIQALARSGDRESASAHIRLFRQKVGDNPRMRVSVLRAEAIVSQAEREVGKALEALELAHKIAKQHGLLGELRQLEALLSHMTPAVKSTPDQKTGEA